MLNRHFLITQRKTFWRRPLISYFKIYPATGLSNLPDQLGDFRIFCPCTINRKQQASQISRISWETPAYFVHAQTIENNRLLNFKHQSEQKNCQISQILMLKDCISYFHLAECQSYDPNATELTRVKINIPMRIRDWL